MRLIATVAVATLALAVAGTAADAKGKKAGAKSYSFNVLCPAIAPVPVSTGSCTAAGKSEDAARSACQVQHNFCYLQSPKKATKVKKASKKAKTKKA